MRRQSVFGVGAVLLSVTYGCSSDNSAPGSKVESAMGGAAGSGGQAGSIALGLGDAGSAGSGGVAGAAGSGGGTAGTNAQGGSAAAGAPNHGGSGAGGSTQTGKCLRAAASDADCADFYPDKPQAYACDSTSAYLTLNGMHNNQCANASVVNGAKFGACCPP